MNATRVAKNPNARIPISLFYAGPNGRAHQIAESSDRSRFFYRMVGGSLLRNLVVEVGTPAGQLPACTFTIPAWLVERNQWHKFVIRSAEEAAD